MKITVSLTKANIISERIKSLIDEIRGEIFAVNNIKLTGIDLLKPQAIQAKSIGLDHAIEQLYVLINTYAEVRTAIESANVEHQVSKLLAEDRVKQSIQRSLGAVKRELTRYSQNVKLDDLGNTMVAVEIADAIEDPKDRLQALSEIRVDASLVTNQRLQEIELAIQQLSRESTKLRDQVAEINRGTQIELDIKDDIAEKLCL